MNDVVVSLLALIVTLGILITLHEFGHFWVARRLGVKVLRFSVGFGRPLWLHRGRVDGTEFAVTAIPLGGYVRMLDEREGEVPAHESHRAFNRQSVWARIAIVAAGPAFNLIFAIVAYSLMFMIGVPGTRPLLDAPMPDTAAAAGGFRQGDLVVAVDGEPTPTLQAVVMALLDRGLAGGEVIEVQVKDLNETPRLRTLDPRAVHGLAEASGALLEKWGLTPWRPSLAPVIGHVQAGGAAERAGLRIGDRIVTVDDKPVADWQQWVTIIQRHPDQPIAVQFEREGERQRLTLTPQAAKTEQGTIGRIGAGPRVPEDTVKALRVEIRHGPLQAILEGVTKTWDMSLFTLRMLGRMLIGKASLDNISGPLTIAQFAGESASSGWLPFLSFLALVSISLGVLNLLPVPVLDGGHLLYYLIELVKGSPLPDMAQELGQRLGIVLLAMLMGLALFNDLARLLG